MATAAQRRASTSEVPVAADTGGGAAMPARASVLRDEDYRRLFHSMAQGVVYQDAEGNIFAANPAAQRILGLSLDQMTGRTSSDPRWRAIREDGSDFPGEEHPAMVALRTGREVTDVVMGVHHAGNGGRTWIRINAVPQFRQGEDTPSQVYTTFEDITEQRTVEIALEERVKELSCLYAVSFLVEQDGTPVDEILQNVVDILPASWQHPDATRAQIEWAGRRFSTPQGTCEGSPWKQSSNIVVGGETVGSVTICYTGGRPAEGGPFLPEEHKLLDAIARHIGVMLERRQARAEIEQLARFPSENPYPVLRVSVDGAVLFANSAGTQLLQNWGCQKGETLPAKWRAFAAEAVRDRGPKTGEAEYAGKAISLTFAPVGESATVNVYGMDITSQRRAQQREKELQDKLARAERMEALGVLAGGIAHDFNNLLSPNVTLPEIILEDLKDLSPEQCPNIEFVRENITSMFECSLRAAETIKDISVLSRAHVLSKRPLSLNGAVTEFLRSHAFTAFSNSAPDVTVTAELDPDAPCVLGVRAHLDRLLLNLVRNAVLAVEGKGSVTIKTSFARVTAPIVAYEPIAPGEYVVLTVSDTGTGIDGDVLGRMFEPFFTTRKQPNRTGSGLGLSVVHGIVKSHGGAVDVTTQPDRGTTFAVYLPPADAEEQVADVGSGPSPHGTERILVVDDEPSQILTARNALERLGYSVSSCQGGREALSRFRQAHEGGEKPPFDLVLLDMLMEPDFDGIATLRGIRELYPHQKVMIASGHAADAEAEEEARGFGADWLAKPYQRGELAKAVRTQLDRDQ